MTFKNWYKENKDGFNEKRRKRYQTDPEYREKVRQLSATRNAERKKEALENRPADYYCSIAELEVLTDISKKTFYEWKSKGYIPEPAKYRGRYYLTYTQVSLLTTLRLCYARNRVGRRFVGRNKTNFQDTIKQIQEKW